MDPVNTYKSDNGETWTTLKFTFAQWCALRDHLSDCPEDYSPLGVAKFQVDRGIAAARATIAFSTDEIAAMLERRPDMVSETADLAYVYAVLQNAMAS